LLKYIIDEKIYFLFLFWLISGIVFQSQAQNAKANYALIKGKSFVQSKNYYLLTLFQNLPEVKHLLSNDATLKSITTQKIEALNNVSKQCQNKVSCLSESMQFSETEIEEIGKRLGVLYAENNALGKLVSEHLIPSGTYILAQNLLQKNN